jgi:hypothetical protein
MDFLQTAERPRTTLGLGGSNDAPLIDWDELFTKRMAIYTLAAGFGSLAAAVIALSLMASDQGITIEELIKNIFKTNPPRE